MPRWQVELAPAPLRIEVNAQSRSDAIREAAELFETLLDLADLPMRGHFIGAVAQTDPVPIPNKEARAPVRRNAKPNK